MNLVLREAGNKLGGGVVRLRIRCSFVHVDRLPRHNGGPKLLLFTSYSVPLFDNVYATRCCDSSFVTRPNVASSRGRKGALDVALARNTSLDRRVGVGGYLRRFPSPTRVFYQFYSSISPESRTPYVMSGAPTGYDS